MNRAGFRSSCVALAVGTVVALALGPSSAAAQAPDGAALYRQHCRTCHGAKGTPTQRMTGLYPGLRTLADSAFLAGRSVDSIVIVIKKGAGRDMKPFADKLSPEEMAAVAQFVRTLGRTSGGPQ